MRTSVGVYAVYGLVPMLWSGSFIAIERAVGHLAPMTAAWLRVTLALPALIAVARWRGQSLRVPREVLGKVLLTGFFALGLPFSLLFVGERTTSPGIAGVLNGTVPLWVFVLGVTVFRKTGATSLRQLPAVAMGFLGVGLVFWSRLQGAEAAGVMLITAMAIAYAVSAHLNRALFSMPQKIGRMANLVVQHVSGWVYLTAAMLWVDGIPNLSSISEPEAWMAIGYLGLVSTALAFSLFYFLIDRLGAVRASTVNYLIPPFAVLWDFLLNGRTLGVNELAGAATVLAAVVWVQKA